MNTPAHVLLNLAAVPNGRWAGCALAALAGALLPDATGFVFYGYHKFIAGTPEAVIWREAYFDPAWQSLFDLSHSFPVAVAIGLLGWWRRSLFFEALALSLCLHSLMDLPLHHDDGHRHFYPLINWRFDSPVSYWDPNHFGDVFAVVELGIGIAATMAIVRTTRPLWVKITAGLTAAAYAGFIVFAMIVWGGMG